MFNIDDVKAFPLKKSKDYNGAKTPKTGYSWQKESNLTYADFKNNKDPFGLVPEKDIVILDFDDESSIEAIKKYLTKLDIKTFMYQTTKGLHLWFRHSEFSYELTERNILKNCSHYLTANGIECDVRLGGKGYVAIRLSYEGLIQDRTDSFENVEELAVIPHELIPVISNVKRTFIPLCELEPGFRNETFAKFYGTLSKMWFGNNLHHDQEIVKWEDYLRVAMHTLNHTIYEVPSDDLFEKINEVAKYVEEVMEFVDVVDNIKNPTGIYQYVKKYSYEHGTHHYKTMEINGKNEKVYSHYKENDEELFTLVVVDHIGLLQPEYDSLRGKKLSPHETLAKWSTDYCVGQICKHMKYCVINVQQVGMSSDDVTHFKAGKLEPSISDAGKNKEILQDAHLIVSLFAPDRYELSNHDGYDIKKLKDAYRSLKVLKNRKGKSNIKVALYFDGATGRFKELPPAAKINYGTKY